MRLKQTFDEEIVSFFFYGLSRFERAERSPMVKPNESVGTG